MRVGVVCHGVSLLALVQADLGNLRSGARLVNSERIFSASDANWLAARGAHPSRPTQKNWNISLPNTATAIDFCQMPPNTATMDLPKCRTCGERHRLGPCPSFSAKGSGEAAGQLTAAERAGSRPVAPSTGKLPREWYDGSNPSLEVPRPETRRGRPLRRDRDKTLAALKPWEPLGMSERTYYRRKAEGKL